MSAGAAPPAAVTFDSAADELYGLPLGRFTTRRNELAAEARAAGDRSLSTRIKGLRRPTAVGWLVNQLVREHPEEIPPLLALGSALREATASVQGPALRDLATQQRRLLTALVSQARQIASATGQPVSEETARGVADTLQAALADPAAAAEVAGGRLTAGLTPPAFAGITAVAATDPSPPGTVATAPVASDRLSRARADLGVAAAEADEARTALEHASTAVDQADDLVRREAAQVEALRAQLEAATRRQADAASQARDAHAALDQAPRAVRDAEQRLRRAHARVDALAGQAQSDGGG